MKRIDARNRDGKHYLYLTKRELGAGTFATVWLAEKVVVDESEDDDSEENHVGMVAVKMSHTGIESGSRLYNEAKILRILGDTSDEKPRRIVRIGAGGDVLETDDPHGGTKKLIELEYLDGKTLREWLEDDWEEKVGDDLYERVYVAARFTRQLTEGLQELNDASEKHPDMTFMHRDLKPENVMVTADGLRLFDFNVSTDRAHATMTREVGSVSYWSPEIVLDQKYDERADYYSLGVIFWELLHGDRPDISGRTRTSEEFQMDWPSETFQELEDDLHASIYPLVSGLICSQKHRFPNAEVILDHLKKLEKHVKSIVEPPPTFEEVVEEFDLIELISELRPSGQASVVADVDERGELQEYIRKRTRVEDPLEEYLVDQIRGALDGDPEAPRLLMLSGNAGDGKSYLIDRLKRHHLRDVHDFDERVEYIADATHAMEPSESQQERLEKFFAAFGNGEKQPEKDIYVIAMNTGMVIRFFETAKRRLEEGVDNVGDFSRLYDELQRQLGLKRYGNGAGYDHRVEVINLDLRSMLTEQSDKTSFFERMIEKLDPKGEEKFLTAKARECEDCRAQTLCPVRFNLEALQRDDARRAVVKVLRRAELDPEIHLSPRNLWGFLYRIITGGIERLDLPEREEGDRLCDVMRKRYDDRSSRDWLLNGHFNELMFEQGHIGGIWSVLEDHDPAFSVVPVIDRLQTLLSVDKNFDTSEEVIEDKLGGDGKSLEGLQLDKLLAELKEYPARDREDSAVRRHVFFNEETFDQYYNFGTAAQFEALLDAYAAYSRDPGSVNREQEDQLTELGRLVREAVIHSYGRRIDGRSMLRVSQPNVRSSSMLLVEAQSTDLDKFFDPIELIQRNVHIEAHVRGQRTELLEHLGYRPKILTLNVAGHRLMVDQALHEFLVAVRRGQQPSAHDLAQFQALRFIAERMGNKLAEHASELFVLDGEDGTLSKLSKSGFGTYRMSAVASAQ